MVRIDNNFRITKFKGKAIAVAVGALFAATAPQSGFAVNTPDGGTIAVTANDTTVFTGAAGSLTGIATVADSVAIGAVTVTNTGTGTLTFAGASAAGAIGGAANTVGLVNFNGVAGKTVTATNLFATNVSMGAGTFSPTGNITAAVNFAGDGTINLASQQVLTGAVTTTTTNTGTLVFAVPSGNLTFATGALGTSTNLLKSITATSTRVTGTFGGNVSATTITAVGSGNTAFGGDVTGTVNFSGPGTITIAADKKIVGSVTTDTVNFGTLIFGTATAASTTLVSGAIGATNALVQLTADSGAGKAVSFGGAIAANTVALAGTGTTSVAGDITAATKVNFTADGTLSMAAGTKIVGALDSAGAGTGTATFAANTANITLVSSTIGATNALKAVNVAAGAGFTATITGAVAATTVSNTGTGTLAFSNDVTGAVNFGADGTVSVAADKKIIGAVTNTTAGQGTLTFGTAGASTTLVSGATGSTGTGLKAVNIVTGGGFTSTLTGAVKAGTVTVTGPGTAAFTGGVTGNINIGGVSTVTTGQAITGNVDNTTGNTGVGTLTLAATKGVTGNIGATNALNVINSDSTGGTTAFGGTVRAATITLAGTGTTTFADTVTGAVNFTADGTATVAAGKNIVGAVTNTTNNNGTLNFLGGTTTGGNIGSTGTGLVAVNFQGGTVNIGHNITAAAINFNGASVNTFTAARTLTGNVAAAGTATVDTGAFNTTITGTFGAGATTTLKTALTNATTAGQFNAAGNATVAAGTKVFVNVGAFAVADGAIIKVVNGTGGNNVLALTAGNVTTNSAVLSFTGRAGDNTGTLAGLAATGEDLYVVAARAAGGLAGVSGLSSTASGFSALQALNAIAVGVPAPAVGSDMALVVNTFNSYNVAQLQSEGPKLAPTTGSAITGAGMGTVGQALNLVNTRMASIRGDSSVLAIGVAGSGVSAGATMGREFWVKGFGNNSTQKSYDGFAGYGGNSYGVAGGVDTSIGNDMRVGVALAYAQTRIGYNNDGNAGAGTNANVKTYQITGYGSKEFGQAYLDAMIGYANHRNDGNRQAALGRTATSSANADQWTARIGGGYRIAMSGKTVFTPLASLEFTNFRQKAYTESGAGAISLNVDAVNTSRVKGGIGARISGEGAMGDGTVYRPEAHVGVYNDFRNNGVDTSASFSGGGSSFVTLGQKVQRSSFNVGTGITWLQGKTGSVGLVYDYEGRSSYKAHNVSLQGRWAF